MQDEIREFTLAGDPNQAGCLQLLYVVGDSRRAHLVHSVQFGAGRWSGATANCFEDLIPSRLGQGACDARKLLACYSPGSVGCHRFPKVRPIGFQCLASPLSQHQFRACACRVISSYRTLRRKEVLPPVATVEHTLRVLRKGFLQAINNLRKLCAEEAQGVFTVDSFHILSGQAGHVYADAIGISEVV